MCSALDPALSPCSAPASPCLATSKSTNSATHAVRATSGVALVDDSSWSAARAAFSESAYAIGHVDTKQLVPA